MKCRIGNRRADLSMWAAGADRQDDLTFLCRLKISRVVPGNSPVISGPQNYLRRHAVGSGKMQRENRAGSSRGMGWDEG